MSSAEHARAVVIDNGTGWIRAGFTGEDAPRVVFPAVLGVPRTAGPVSSNDVLIGDAALAKQDSYNVQRPLERGRIVSWEGMQLLWRHAFRELGVSAEDQALVLTKASEPSTNPPHLPAAYWGKLTQLMFESFGVPALSVVDRAALIVQTSGRNTGLAVSIGESILRVVPVHDTFALLQESVQVNLGEEVGKDRPKSEEALFQPTQMGIERPSLTTLVHQTILKCPAAIHGELFSNIMLAGGSSLVPGVTERLTKELLALAPQGNKVELNAGTERRHAAWKGGTLAAAKPSSAGWMSIEDYERRGPELLSDRRARELDNYIEAHGERAIATVFNTRGLGGSIHVGLRRADGSTIDAGPVLPASLDEKSRACKVRNELAVRTYGGRTVLEGVQRDYR